LIVAPRGWCTSLTLFTGTSWWRLIQTS